MGTHSPGRYRRKGRNAFVPGETNPEDFFDYPKKSWWYKHHLEDFLEGWEEAKRKYEKEENKMIEFPIYFDDLNEETQKRFLEVQGLSSPEEGNYDITPIAIVQHDDEDIDECPTKGMI